MKEQESIHYELITKYYKGEISETEKQSLDLWVDESPENKKFFEELGTIWNISGKVLKQKDHFNPDVESALQKVKSSLDIPIGTDKLSGKVRTLYRKIASIAAILVLLLGSIFIFRNLIQDKTYDPAKIQIVEIQAGAHNVKEIMLPDGSRVSLNKGSSISYYNNFDQENRELFLSGEAYFEVINTGGHPFTVYAGQGKIKVLGTSFGIKISENKVFTMVTEGKVSLSEKDDPENTAILTAGHKGILDQQNNLSVEKSFNPNVLAWKSKQLVFNDSEFKEIITTLNNYFNLKVEVSDSALYNCTFTGTFDDPTLNEVLKVMSASLNIEYKTGNSTVILSGTGCES